MEIQRLKVGQYASDCCDFVVRCCLGSHDFLLPKLVLSDTSSVDLKCLGGARFASRSDQFCAWRQEEKLVCDGGSQDQDRNKMKDVPSPVHWWKTRGRRPVRSKEMT